ncbi:glycerol dehydrogenase, partial [Enterococcus faecium]
GLVVVFKTQKLAKPVFTFPTIGSNSTPVTGVCVFYNEEGVMDGLFFPSKQPVHTFIDTAIIAEAPVKYLWAGIVDGLSKD